MLTGQRAFVGESVTDVLGAVVRAEPDWQAFPPEVPPAIRALLRGCLQKDWAQRVADISTARFVIDAASSLATPLPLTERTTRRWPIAVVAGSALLALASLGLVSLRPRSESAAVTRYTVTPAKGQEVIQAAGVDVALSPDGSWMVYVGQAPNKRRDSFVASSTISTP